ncbi:MAG: hypothetical protein ACM3SQ_15925 [Betaproteobacteria bacterium]
MGERRPMPAARRRTAWRLPLPIAAIVAMVCGGWLGLVRLGWNLPLWDPDLTGHGPLMVCGFLGTVISLERAVALGAAWGYAGPALVAAGALALDLGPAARFGPLLIAAGSGVTAAMLVAVWRRQPSLFVATMALGTFAWVIGNVQWLSGAAIYRVVFWWMAFLVLTIAGERLELNRVLRPTALVRAWFAAAALVILGGAAAAVRWPDAGVRVVGTGLLLLTGWLVRHDVARRTVHQTGVTRFMAVCLLAGYAWLGVGGTLAAATGVADTGVVYDATLHAVFLGFVMSMVFAHAPVIFPAVAGMPLEYRPIFYLHAVVLHVSLLLRIVGDLVDVLGRWRAWGGLFNAIALLLFVANTARSILKARAMHAPLPRSA